MKILVTGGTGFIGSHTVVELFSNGDIPIIIDDFRNSEPFILERIKEITGNTPVFL
jgi:UDP-glucose 4-epimerase